MADGQERCDIAVIGAGIAGASIAAELSARHRVVLVERETQAGYHTTGRSAAIFAASYGPEPIRALSRASADFFNRPPNGFCDGDLLSPRDVLMIARKDQLPVLDAMLAERVGEAGIEPVDAAEIQNMMPLMRPSYAEAGMIERGAGDIDVDRLHQAYLKRFRAAGGSVRLATEVKALDRAASGWRVTTGSFTVTADIVVNAGGAWGDEIARLAGALPIGLVPKRRTAIIVPAPSGQAPDSWPLTVDIAEEFYLKPEAGKLLLSPADETPSPPCDAQPEELDIAICVDRIETAFDLKVRRIENKWAGLRSFVADKSPVAGFDPQAPGFFWLAGQGGYGIQTAPALARLAAALVDNRPLPSDLTDHGVDAAALAPDRLAVAA